MKSLVTSLFIWATLLISQPSIAVIYTYNVLPGVAGQTTTFHAATGTSLTYSMNINVTTAGNYDFAASGITHIGLVGAPSPYVRTSFGTTVDAGEVLDASGTLVATMTSVKLPTTPGFSGIGTKLYATGVSLLPGVYNINLTTSCTTLCSYFQNYFSFVANPSAVNLTPTITMSSLPDGTIGTAYSVPVTYTDPTGNYTQINVTGLPSGLALTGGVAFAQPLTISGTPTAIGISNVTITATDPSTNLATSTTLPLTIHDAAINFAPTLQDGTANIPYTVTLATATGGTGNFTYTQTGLPKELTLTGNTISGTPIAGVYNIDITATDSAGSFVVVPVTLNIVASAPVACSGINVGITSFTAGNIYINSGTALLDNLSTINLGSSNTIFQNGLLNWNQSGLIIDYTGVINATGCILDSLTVKPSITISTTSLPKGTLNTLYTTPLTITGGLAPYSTTVSGLPAGLSFDGTNITGTPSASGDFSVSVTSIDSLGFSVTSTLPITIDAQPIIFTPSLSTGTVGSLFSTTISATGGVGPYTYTATNLPSGLVLTGNTVSGTPTVSGTSTVALTVTDAVGTSSTQNVAMLINPIAGTFTIKDNSKGAIKAVGPGYLMVGTKKLIWAPTTTIIVNTPSGVKNTIDSSVIKGMKISWKGLRDKKLNTVLTSAITIN